MALCDAVNSDMLSFVIVPMVAVTRCLALIATIKLMNPTKEAASELLEYKAV